jgi:type VI secretion system protein ImpK
MQSVATKRAAVNRRGVRLDSDLVHIATPVLDVIMQVKAGLLVPSSDLRVQISDSLKELEVEGDNLGYKERQVQDAKFALAAFVDETVLTARFPMREDWEKHPLQLEYFGEHLAGVTFFNRLDELLKSPANEADAIEVYYLCLVLGYKGKYKIYYEDQLKMVIEQVAEALRRANRLRDGALSPHWRVTDQPEPVMDTGIPGWVRTGGAIAICAVILVYVIFSMWLHSDVSAAMERLLR